MSKSKQELRLLKNKDRDKIKPVLTEDDKFLTQQWREKLKQVCENTNEITEVENEKQLLDC